ncbi:thioredoxin [Malaciobacter marinus]|uniref:TlpA family protein disulfide reductase n=1 Tax=Malaciobacter marinus TaxID=505249 RepID=UPI000C075A5F|nr:TlpA disulfide reductase family protein [Malaciobacter marinus]PHO12240.1 thioredoxin [Malaciobacter marinus]
MQFKNIAFIAILSILFFTGCGDSKVNEDGKTEAKIQTKFQLSNIDGTTFTINKEGEKLIFDWPKKKIVLLNFFGTWCNPCIAEIPHFNNLIKKYQEDLEIVAVSLEKKNEKQTTNEALESFKNKYNIQYKIVNSEEKYNLASALGEIKTIPTMFLIDKKGNIKQKYTGIIPEEMIETDIKKELEDK